MVGACDICGKDAMTNVSIRLETEKYYDGPPRAKLPRMTFCHDCADEVSSYLEERAGTHKEDEDGGSPFTDSDAEEIIERLEQNSDLVLEIPPSGYGYRYVEGEFKLAVIPLPAPPETQTFERERLKERITSASRVILKRLDEDAWRRYAEN